MVFVIGHGVKHMNEVAATVGAFSISKFTASCMAGILNKRPVEVIAACFVFIFPHHFYFLNRMLCRLEIQP